jgi:hypothetical protein
VLLIQPSGSQATLVNPTSVAPTFVVDRPGTYMVQLTVNDGQVDSAPDVVTIDKVNSAPVADAGPPQTVEVGTTVTLQGNRSTVVMYRQPSSSRNDDHVERVSPLGLTLS